MIIFRILWKILKIILLIVLIALLAIIAFCIFCYCQGVTPLQMLGIDEGQVLNAVVNNAITQLESKGVLPK